METDMEKDLDSERSDLALKNMEVQQRGIEVGIDPDRDLVRTHGGEVIKQDGLGRKGKQGTEML